MTRAPRCLRAVIATLAALAVLAAPCAPGAPIPSAWAAGRSGSAVVEYEPWSWPFAISASGSGQIELVGVRLARASPHQAAPGVVVRDGTAEIEVFRGQVLDFRLVPDEGVSVESVSVGGEAVSDRIGADGALTLAAEDARVELEVAFGEAATAGGGAQAPAGGSGGAAGPRGGLARTGDLPWVGAGALALAALCAYCAARCAARSDPGGKTRVQPRESA